MAQLSSTQIYGDLKVDGEIKNKASTTTEGVVQLNDAVNSTSTTEGATANAVKKVNDTLATHKTDMVGHVTASERTTWNGKLDKSGGSITGNLNVSGNLGIGGTVMSEYDGEFEISSPFVLRLTTSNVNGTTVFLRDTEFWGSRVYVDGTLEVDGMNVKQEITNLKSSVSDVKNKIASAITAKGVSATGSDSFDTLSTKIRQIGGFAINDETFVPSVVHGDTPPIDTNAYVDDTPEDYEKYISSSEAKFIFLPNPEGNVQVVSGAVKHDYRYIDNYGSLYIAWELWKITGNTCTVRCSGGRKYNFTVFDKATIYKTIGLTVQ